MTQENKWRIFQLQKSVKNSLFVDNFLRKISVEIYGLNKSLYLSYCICDCSDENVENVRNLLHKKGYCTKIYIARFISINVNSCIYVQPKYIYEPIKELAISLEEKDLPEDEKKYLKDICGTVSYPEFRNLHL